MDNNMIALLNLYLALGGNLTDTYDNIANGIPVSDYTIKPDIIDAIAERAKSAGIELPAVTSDDNSKLLTVVEGAWAKADPTGIPFSTSEVKIGEMDGKGVYQQIFEVADINPGNSKFIAHSSISINDKVLNIFGTIKSYMSHNLNDITPIPIENQGVNNFKVKLIEGSSDYYDLLMNSSGEAIEGVTYSAIITVQYVKNEE